MINHYGSLDHVKIITMAPELPFALETIKALTKMGIVVSVGKPSNGTNDFVLF